MAMNKLRCGICHDFSALKQSALFVFERQCQKSVADCHSFKHLASHIGAEAAAHSFVSFVCSLIFVACWQIKPHGPPWPSIATQAMLVATPSLLLQVAHQFIHWSKSPRGHTRVMWGRCFEIKFTKGCSFFDAATAANHGMIPHVKTKGSLKNRS